MSHEIKIPSVGESITSATIDTWFKADGDYVKSGDVLLSFETDKVSQELETEHDGILRHAAAEGDEVEIGAVVATIEEGEPPEDAGDSGAEEPKAKGDRASDAEASPAGEGKAAASGEKEEQTDAQSSTGAKDIKATPVARKVAEDQGIDLATVRGTGTGGRITKSDVFAAAEERDRAAKAAAKAKKKGDAGEAGAVAGKSASQPSPPAPGASGPRTTRRKMSPLRRKIADHLLNAQHQAALLTTFNECDMSAVMALRKRVQEDFVAKHGVKLGFMSFFVKAVVQALQAVPSVNARIEGDEMVENHYYDIGVAVGTDKGLIVPVLRDCDGKSFAGIEQDIIDRATAAREGKIQLADLQGGVFTITNGGIYGSMLSTPILNPPQSGILGMHNIQQRPVAVDGEVVIRPMMYLALTYDHRLVDGKEAVTFLVKVKECIENPERMMLEV